MVTQHQPFNRLTLPLVLAIILLGMVVSAHATTTTRVDRQSIQESETFRLSIKSNSSNQPDLSPLHQNFEILNTSKSSQMTFINGRMESNTEWVINLAPKKVGTLLIPAIVVDGQASQPLTVEVIPATVVNSKGRGQDVFLNTFVEPESPYVQAQMTFAVQLFHAIDIVEGSLSEPKIDNTIIERLGNDISFQTNKHGRRYHVTERRYAIFPQVSGALTIPSITFSGQVLDNTPSRQGRVDPFSRFFQQSRTRSVRHRSQLIELVVKAQPSSAKHHWWLPAQFLSLTQSWSPNQSGLPEFRVGEPVTRTIRIEAIGLTGAQLPQLSAEKLAWAKQYSDQPTVETKNNGKSLIGIQEEKLAIVPMKTGNFQLPEVVIRWWDTRSDKAQVAKLPAQKIHVLPAIGQQGASLPISQSSAQNTLIEESSASTNITPQPVTAVNHWPWVVAVFSILGWLLTVGWFYREKSRLRRHGAGNDQLLPSHQRERVSSRVAIGALQRACTENDPQRAKAALLDWATSVWGSEAPATLNALTKQVDHEIFGQALAALDRLLYSQSSLTWDGDEFWQQTAKRLKQSHKPKKIKSNPLPALYPEKAFTAD